jgi:cytochrome c-type biogenesis protein CcmH
MRREVAEATGFGLDWGAGRWLAARSESVLRITRRGFARGWKERILPRRRRGAEKKIIKEIVAPFFSNNTFLVIDIFICFVSASLRLCGKVFLLRAHHHNIPSGFKTPRTWLFTMALLLFASLPALAVEPGEQLKDPVLEARARSISAGLRCLVCQNETIDESNAGLAHDIRILLRERLTAGDTDAQAIKAIVDRYGEFVLLNPPVRPATYVLWFGPGAILLAGLIGCIVWVRRRSGGLDTMAPLSPDERSRLDQVLREADR